MHQLPQKCSNPKYTGKNLTNRVLVEEAYSSDKQKRVTYYCPAYLRLQIQNFSEMNFQELSASINSILMLTVNFRGLCPTLQQKIRPLLKLGFNRDDSLQIKQSSKSKAISMHVNEGGIYTYIIYKVVHVAMKPDIKWFPLNLVHLIMSIYIKDIQLNDDMLEEVVQDLQITIQRKWIDILQLKKNNDQQKIRQTLEIIKGLEKQKEDIKSTSNINIKFNFMDCKIQYMKMTPPAEQTFGNYRLAKAKMNLQYTNIPSSKRVRPKLKPITKKQKSESLMSNQKQIDHSRVKPFNYAHFEVPVYKVPDVAITTIFFPLWFLAILTLGIYFQDNGLADRIISLSSLMIAFVALIPVIRQELPQSPHITLVQYLVYAQILTGILCFGESIQVRDYKDYIFLWYENGYFLVSLAITCGQIVTIIILWLIHKCNRVPIYNSIVFLRTNVGFRYQKWFNEDCDKHFRRKIDNFRIKVLEVNKKLQNFKEVENKLEEHDMQKHQQNYFNAINKIDEFKLTSELYKKVWNEK